MSYMDHDMALEVAFVIDNVTFYFFARNYFHAFFKGSGLLKTGMAGQERPKDIIPAW